MSTERGNGSPCHNAAVIVCSSFHTCNQNFALIFRWKTDGPWYIYPQFLAHGNLNNVYKNAQKCFKIFKPRLLSLLSTGTNIVKVWISLCFVGCVRFARHRGKMYSRHLFCYIGFRFTRRFSLSCYVDLIHCYDLKLGCIFCSCFKENVK